MSKKSKVKLKRIVYFSIMAVTLLIITCGVEIPGCIQPVDQSEPINGDILNPEDLDNDSRDIIIKFKGNIRVDSNQDGIYTVVTQENEDAKEPDLLLIGNRLTFKDKYETDITFSTDWIEFDPPTLKIIPDGPLTINNTYAIELRSIGAIRMHNPGGPNPQVTWDFDFSFKTREPDGEPPKLLEISGGGVTISQPTPVMFVETPLTPNMDIVMTFNEEMNFPFAIVLDMEIEPENFLNPDNVTSDNITFTFKLAGLDIGTDFEFHILSTDDGVAGLPMAAVVFSEGGSLVEAQYYLKGLFGDDFEIPDPLDFTKYLPPCRDISGEPLSYFDDSEGLGTWVPRGVEIRGSTARVRIDEPMRDSCTNKTVLDIEGIAYVGDTEQPDKNVTSVQILINGLEAGSVIPDDSGNFSSTVDLASIDDLGSYEGPLTIRANASTGDGKGGHDEIAVIRDITPPVVAITSPSHNAYLSSLYVDIEGTVDDFTEIVKVNGYTAEVVPDGTTGDPNDGIFTVANIFLPLEGSNTIEAVATDCPGNQGSASIIVIRDTVPPQITIDYPLDGSFINTSRVVVSGEVDDATSGVQWVKVNGEEATLIDGNFEGIITASEGPFTIKVTASDRAGNISESDSVNVFIDTVPPTVDVDPLVCQTLGSVTVLASCEDVGSGIASCEVSINGGFTWYVSPHVYVGLADGSYITLGRATDYCGNTASDMLEETFEVDTVAEVSITSPVNGVTIYANDIVINGTADTDISMVMVTSNQGHSESSLVNSNGNWSVILLGVTVSPLVITAQGVDDCGNIDCDSVMIPIIQVWYVDDDATTGLGTGKSWVDAFTTIQEAVANALSGDMIWVAKGTYTSDSTYPVLTMKDDVKVYGGFMGGEIGLSERVNPTDYPTILNGENMIDHVVRGASNARLDGFVVTGGIGYKGGGMYN
ncbi:MAG: hypothetical protein JSU92_11595, partial [Deltaproteobacteria bacterium]